MAPPPPSEIDLVADSAVDLLAKAAASRQAPSAEHNRQIVDTSGLVEAVARWVGQITVRANHFPHTTKVVLRDSDAKAKTRRPTLVPRPLASAPSSVKRKRGPVSPDSLLACLPLFV